MYETTRTMYQTIGSDYFNPYSEIKRAHDDAISDGAKWTIHVPARDLGPLGAWPETLVVVTSDKSLEELYGEFRDIMMSHSSGGMFLSPGMDISTSNKFVTIVAAAAVYDFSGADPAKKKGMIHRAQKILAVSHSEEGAAA